MNRTLPMPAPSAVPLVGQPLDIVAWTVVVSVVCRCARGGTLQLVLTQSAAEQGSGQVRCPACGRPMHIVSIAITPEGQLAFNIEVGIPAPAGES